ncbi:transmembrane protein 54b isoform X1 [Misgurnus anguillicaudatus]|uniref:transmembrane protein 54b isoform X1 n=1 Tax=Misgurnus anguillicaudatus TaxID=75329 RepID=UPI003CCF6DCE
MDNSGSCCSNLEEQKVVMKIGISMVLVGHANFLLGALVHGVVLRHFSLHVLGQAMESAISNVIALTAGLLGVVIGILTIIFSKNMKNRILACSLFVLSAIAGLVATASVIGLSVSLVKTIIRGDKSLLAYCGYTDDDMSHISIANECPFDPTRIYSTTIILWVPLIIISAVEMIFSCRLLKVSSIAYLSLPCCLGKHLQQDPSRSMETRRVTESPLLPLHVLTSRCCQGDEERRLPVRPPDDSRAHRSIPPAQFHQKRSSRFNRGALERSSIWI